MNLGYFLSVSLVLDNDQMMLWKGSFLWVVNIEVLLLVLFQESRDQKI